MTKKYFSFLAALAVAWQSAAQLRPQGDYVGQSLPGTTPALFAPGFISAGKHELNSAFSPDLRQFYYCIASPDNTIFSIVFTEKKEDGTWSEPEAMPYSAPADYSDADPTFSPDGNRFYFISTRPRFAGDTTKKNWDIWYMDRQGTGWASPRNAGPTVNSDNSEYYMSATAGNTLYFCAKRSDSRGDHDLYRARFVNGQYTAPENLGDVINTDKLEFDAIIAPDESYLIFTGFDRPGGYGSGDLYISFNKNGQWTEPQNLGPQINSAAFEQGPKFTPDGKYLMFSSHRKEVEKGNKTHAALQNRYSSALNGLADIYWVSSDFLKSFTTQIK